MSSVNFGYGCIIDAGSSGSRIYLYRWPKDDDDDHDELDNNNNNNKTSLAKVEQQAIFSDERHVGISNERGGGIDALEELLSAAKVALPSDVDPSDVAIHLGATAGMRLLKSEAEAIVIMSRVRSMIHASGFLFRDDWARTISGEEESVYGWLVANYLRNNGNFPNNDDDSKFWGSLDLGGASTQISMVSTSSTTSTSTSTLAGEDEDQDKDHLFPLHIGNLKYPLYTQSYLNYGADQARMRYDKLFVSAPSSSSSNKDKVNPCYPDGYTNADTDVSGSSNWDECFYNVAKLFDKQQQQHSNLRGGDDDDDSSVIAPLPIVDNDDDDAQQFIAMSVFVFVWDFLGLNIGTETDDLTTLKEKAGQVCNLPHSEQTTQYDLQMKDRPAGRKTNKPFAQCFNAAFSYHLLDKGYGLPVQQTPIEIYYEINGAKVQWALGLMLVEANRLSSNNKEKSDEIDSMVYNSTSYLFVVLIVLLLILGRSLIRSRRLAAGLSEKTPSFHKIY